MTIRTIERVASYARRAWTLALPLYWLVLAALTHYPQVRIPGEIPKSDKVVHFTAFALLAFLFWRFFAARTRVLAASFVAVAAIVLIAYASIDEYTQRFVGRDSDWIDWIANLSGVTCCLIGLELHRRMRRSRPKPAETA
jgi:VanZ family protein